MPTASTVPATSQPTVNGGGPMTAAIPAPALVFQSTGFTPAAATRTRISVGSGSGIAAGRTSRTSGPPVASWMIARIVPTCDAYHRAAPGAARARFGDAVSGRGRACR